MITRAVQTRRPDKPARFQPEPTLPLVGDGFSRPRPDAGRSSGGFSSPKPEPPNPTDVIYKSNNSGKIKFKFEEIRGDPSLFWWDLDHTWWNPTRFEEIQTDFWRDLRRSKLISTRSRPYLVRFNEIQGDPSLFRRFLKKMYWVFEIPATFAESDNFLNRPNTTQTWNRLNQLTLTVGFRSLCHPSYASGSGPGWVKNRPSPTCGQS